ncbi:SDR family oxidoreductase [Leptospira stimsonii]|uniref:Short chain dehydrogenase n=1 Tax=Leptospira stimsonii TaxID=2202203 RepID=A0A396YTJ0_9LEPT|nr:SDR family oxidoreductase [Leptospira stimsonii]RHX84647.1 short chain dehydrogenase [Leptospira stimsonii]
MSQNERKVVAITGAAGGIGFESALEFYNNGWDLSLCDIDGAMMTQKLTQNKLNSNRILSSEFDITRRESCETWIGETVERFGRLDCLICNAGIAHRSLFKNTDPEVILKVMSINFNSVVFLCHAAIPHLVKGKGSLIGISSVAGFSPLYGRTGYVSSKHALSGFFETIRSELEPELHVCLVYPAFVKTLFDKNTMDGDGKKLTRDKPTIGSHLLPEVVAKNIFRSVAKRKKRIVLSPIAKLSYLLSRLFPNFFTWIMKKNTQSEFL